MNYKVIFILFSMLFASVYGQTCPLRCPSCMMCDTKKGTCTLPRDFVTCTSRTLPGVCMAGACNTKISLPLPITALNKCQTYRCPVSGVCNKVSKPDGTDCSSVGDPLHSACLNGVCKPLILGIVEPMPLRNIGCVGLADGTLCDTNDLFNDGETCVGGICKFPDGTYYGYI